MTREEEIINKGIEYTVIHHPVCIGGGAFADAMREFNRNAAFEAGAKWADKTFLDKACKWLKGNFYDTQDRDLHPEVISSSCNNVEELIEDFRKAML